MNYDAWIKKAIERIETKVKYSDPFILKDLFEGVEWKELSPGECRQLGIRFSNEVKDGNIKNIKKLERAKNNSARYIRIKGEEKK